MRNPFTPTFGIVPPYLAGRTAVLAEMKKAFNNWPGDPNLSSVIIGPRGSGKTALLSCIGQQAKEQGWIVTDTIASKGMLDDILQRSLVVASEFIEPQNRKHLTGISIGQFLGLEWTVDAKDSANWRVRMEALTEKLKAYEIGLLITVDEVRADVEEMIQLASVYQLLIRNGAKLALVMAGLPGNLNDLISNENVSFLRRSRQHYLGKISDSEIERAFRKTVENAGKQMEEAALKKAVEAIGGFPYMMQLVGYAIWEESDGSEQINNAHTERGIRQAVNDFKTGVLNNTYRALSKGDRAFLKAMAEVSDDCHVTDIALRLGKGTGYVATYKTRMLKAGIIEEQPGFTLDFALPAFREYFMEQEGMKP